MRNDSIYEEQARQSLAKNGYAEAKRLHTRWRGQSSEGTFSFAWHNAVLKFIEKIHREEGTT